MLQAGWLISTIHVLVYFYLVVAQAGVPLQGHENFMKQQSAQLGLYNASDKVKILTSANFNSTVLLQKYTSLVEFYNSYCGHCKRFAPTYKKLAKEVLSWRDVLKVSAIDCAAEENNAICREYEVMAYPTLRYFGVGYQPSPNNYGKSVDSQDINIIRMNLAQWISSENATGEVHNWPNFQSLAEKETENIFANLSSSHAYVVLVYEAENSTVGIETILNFLKYPEVNVRRINDISVASKFQIDGSYNKLAIVDRNITAIPYSVLLDTSEAYKNTLKNALELLNVTEIPNGSDKPMIDSASLDATSLIENEAILKEVYTNKHLVYEADLQMAVRSTLFNEIPKISEISGERLLALQRYMEVLKRYNPLGDSGHLFMSSLYEFVLDHNQNLNGKVFEDEVKRLEQQHGPIFSTNHFVGCAPSKPGFRGFTCSLWQIFHYFTVQAAANNQSKDPLEVLQAMHGYVKYYFGCSECSQHFEDMARRRKIWSTGSKDDAILWLWAAHNDVNQRLAGDSTQDPGFPKIQFPSQSSCPQCRKSYTSPLDNVHEKEEINWDNSAVLTFLKNIHNPQHISRFGVGNGSLLQPMAEKLRQKRMIGNVFSEMDMRMGMMLYGFCIFMMVVAFKLFALKGYRKKPYGHDMFGKV